MRRVDPKYVHTFDFAARNIRIGVKNRVDREIVKKTIFLSYACVISYSTRYAGNVCIQCIVFPFHTINVAMVVWCLQVLLNKHVVIAKPLLQLTQLYGINRLVWKSNRYKIIVRFHAVSRLVSKLFNTTRLASLINTGCLLYPL